LKVAGTGVIKKPATVGQTYILSSKITVTCDADKVKNAEVQYKSDDDKALKLTIDANGEATQADHVADQDQK
jgi:hypothetical protein